MSGLLVAAAAPDRDVDVEVAAGPGEVVAVLGANGAGKSTALALAAGLLRPVRGRVVLDGTVLADAGGPGRRPAWTPPHRRRTALMTQDALLLPHLTARDDVAFPLRARGVGRREARRRAEGWLARVDAAALAGRRPSQLSGGQQQRVALARALAAEPRALLLDEPTAALDVAAAPAVRALLAEVLAGGDRCALLVTHDVLDVVALAHRAVVLEHGRVVEHGPVHGPDGVLAAPRSAFAARLAGVGLLRGTAATDGLLLPGGGLVPGTPAPGCGVGTAAVAAVPPSALRVVPAGTAGALPLVVVAVEPRGDVVRLRAADGPTGEPGPAVDVPLGALRPGAAVPGATLAVAVDATAVRVRAALP